MKSFASFGVEAMKDSLVYKWDVSTRRNEKCL